MNGIWLLIVFYAMVLATLHDLGGLIVAMGVLGGIVAVAT